MSRFTFHTRWVPGKENIEADVLSRSPVSKLTEADQLAKGPAAYAARTAVVGLIAEWAGSKDGTSHVALEKKTAATADYDLQDLVVMHQ